ncbi:putative sugar phosphate/phosphate translocator [Diplonema papillatum]|nr:putative sugar phosphate/phosphate translocator [Diplonema papillatum]
MASLFETLDGSGSNDTDGDEVTLHPRPLNAGPLAVFICILLCIALTAEVLKRVGLLRSFGDLASYRATLLTVTLCWYSTSIFLTLFNNWIFYYLYGGLHYPICLTTVHMALKGVIAYVVLWFIDTGAHPIPEGMNVWRTGMPIGIVTGLDICLSNWAQSNFIGVSVYTIVKTSTLVFTYVISIFLKIQPVQLSLTVAVATIMLGIAISSSTQDGGESHTAFKTFVGVMMTIGASFCAGLRWALTEVLLKDIPTKGSLVGKFRVLLWISPAAAASVLLLAIPVEAKEIAGEAVWADPGKTVVVLLLTAFGGCAAVSLLFAELALVQMASALTLAVVGHLKEILVIVFAIIVFSETFTAANTLGMIIAFAGALGYMVMRNRNILDPDGAGAVLGPYQGFDDVISLDSFEEPPPASDAESCEAV